MSTLVEELTQKAKQLPPEERIQLAEELLATVQEVDSEVEAAWDEEIRRGSPHSRVKPARFHDAARAELVHEVQYYAAISPSLGLKFAAAVAAGC